MCKKNYQRTEMMKNINYITSVFIGMIILVNGAMACSPIPPKSYASKKGDYIFVMLLEGKCTKTDHEVEMSATEYTEFKNLTKWQGKYITKKYITKRSGPNGRCGALSRYTLKRQQDGAVLFYSSSIWTPEEWTSESGVTYASPGLYKDDGSNVPEWTVDWYEDSSRHFIVNNGRNLIRLRRTTNESGIALAFYDRGVLTKKYKVKDLIRDVDNIKSTDYCADGGWMKNRKVDNNNNTIMIETLNNEKYVFNTISGEILESKFDSTNETIAKVKLLELTLSKPKK